MKIFVNAKILFKDIFENLLKGGQNSLIKLMKKTLENSKIKKRKNIT